MKIDEAQAVVIAKKYVQEELADDLTEMDFDNPHVHLDEEGYGNMALGMEEDFWLVSFMVKDKSGGMAGYEPESMTVMVGADSGEAYWIPEMI